VISDKKYVIFIPFFQIGFSKQRFEKENRNFENHKAGFATLSENGKGYAN
jgi:hypothetical protein